MQAFLQERIAHHLPNVPSPQVGNTYRVRMRDGALVTGELVKISETQIVLRLPRGNMALPVDRVNVQGTAELFPQEAARQLAVRDVQQRVDELLAAKRAALENPEEKGEEEIPAAGPSARVEKPVYDPMPAPTPERLKPTLQAFAEWMTQQQQRMGGRIVDRLFAKESSGNAVLYLVMDENFQKQDHDTRKWTAVGIQQFWSFRCQSTGVAGLPQAHVVLLDGNGRIVGGSRPEDAADVWVAER
jgi:hypothetical protein